MNRECPTGSFLHSTNSDGFYACEVDSGVDGVTGFSQLRVVSITSLPEGGGGNATAECPSGSILMGGDILRLLV